jgi:Ubiquitin fold domain/ThiF family
MGNCRAVNYKLDHMDWITVKLKAGRIVPALATTTAAVAGLQTLELVKLLKGCKKADHRNVFLNLAVPIMQASEPGDVAKVKLTEKIEVSLWDRWEVKANGANVTLRDVIKSIETQHEGLEVRDIMRGNAPLYFHAIMNAPGKEAEKEKALGSKVAEILGIDPAEDKYVDLNLTCVKKDDSEGKIISGVPPVRVYFE